MLTTDQATARTSKAWLGFAAGSLCALALGGLFAPGDWFAALNKPAWNPPGWLFGPVWTVLYIMIAWAGTIAWRATIIRKRATMWWIAQIAFNALWTPVFFGLHQITLAIAVIAACWVSIIVFMITTASHARPATWMFAPYLAWVSFASMLNIAISVLN
jgi:translocator protein